MKSIHLIICLCVFFSVNSKEQAVASQIVVHHENGLKTVLEVYPDDTFLHIMQEAERIARNDFSTDKTDFLIDYRTDSPSIRNPQFTSTTPRDYSASVTKKEKEDITFIVTTLGRSSLKKIWDAESSLKKAGDRVDRVHPLKFLSTILNHEETKVGLLQIKERGGVVAKKFFNGLYDGLSVESNLNNLKPEYIEDFARSLKINSASIVGPITSKNWKELINVLVELLPRNGKQNRYDM